MNLFETFVVASQLHQSWTQERILNSVTEIQQAQAKQIADQARLDQLREVVYSSVKRIETGRRQGLAYACYQAFALFRFCRLNHISTKSFPSFEDKRLFDQALEYAGQVLQEGIESFSTEEMSRLECYVALEEGGLASKISQALAWEKVRKIMGRHPWFYTRKISYIYMFCCVAVMLIVTFWLDWPFIGAVFGAALPLGLLLIFLGRFLMEPHFRCLIKIIAKTGGTLNWGATKDGVALVRVGILNDIRWNYPSFEPTNKTSQELEVLIQEIHRETAACQEYFFNGRKQLQDE